MNQQEAYKDIFKEYPDVVDVSQMAQMLQISTKTAYKVIAQEKIACFKIGRQYKIPKVSVIDFLRIPSRGH